MFLEKKKGTDQYNYYDMVENIRITLGFFFVLYLLLILLLSGSIIGQKKFMGSLFSLSLSLQNPDAYCPPRAILCQIKGIYKKTCIAKQNDMLSYSATSLFCHHPPPCLF